MYRSCICARRNRIQYKHVHCTYYTKAHLSKFYTNVSPFYDRCQQSPANLIHTIWFCPQLFNCWSKVFAILSDIFDKELELNPLTALFEVTPFQPISLSSFQKSSVVVFFYFFGVECDYNEMEGFSTCSLTSRYHIPHGKA